MKDKKKDIPIDWDFDFDLGYELIKSGLIGCTDPIFFLKTIVAVSTSTIALRKGEEFARQMLAFQIDNLTVANAADLH